MTSTLYIQETNEKEKENVASSIAGGDRAALRDRHPDDSGGGVWKDFLW